VTINIREFRNALGTFATGINVITTISSDGVPLGMTVNSFTSVSLDPPLILVCLDKKSAMTESFVNGKGFGVNILHESQQSVSNDFAGKSEDRFATHGYSTSERENPVLDGIVSFLDCQREEVYEGGDHLILVGRVMSFTYQSDADPLIYFNGAYHGLKGD